MPMATREEQIEYQRLWMQRRRAEWVDDNGPCARCGFPYQLEVDHIDSTTKMLSPKSLWSMSRENPRRITELAKCQVLCHWCHVEKTWEVDRPAKHGVVSYDRGCRCRRCEKSHREQMQRRRAGGRGAGLGT